MSKAAIAATQSEGKNEAHLQELTRALLDFYATYGTGFVDSVELIAYGIVEGSWERKTITTTDVFTAGGGIAASFPFVAGAVEGEYVKTHADSTVNTTLKVRAWGKSDTSPQYKWALDKAGMLDGQSLEKFLNGEAWTQKPSKNPDTYANPKLEYEPKDLTQIEVPELPGALGIFSKALNALKAITVRHVKPESQTSDTASASTASPADPDTAVAAQTERKVAELKLVAGYKEEKINKVALGREKIDVAQPGKPAAATPMEQPTPPDAGKANTPAGRDGVTRLDLGDYVVCGYTYRPWDAIFPKLKLALECTPAQVVFGQALVWYSMREMFAQYLDFCAKFDGVSRYEDGTIRHIGTQAERFRIALEKVSGYLTGELTGELTIDMLTDDQPNNTAKTDLNFVRLLEENLKTELDRAEFLMYRHYVFWMDHYDWLKLAPFGVVAVIERGGKLYYQQNPYPGNPMQHSNQPKGCAALPGRDPADLVETNAYRLYPIISTSAKGQPHFVWVGAPTPLTGDNVDVSVRYSGRFALTHRDPADTPASKSKMWQRTRLATDPPPPWDPTGPFHVLPETLRLNEVALPMLIHQSADAAEEIAQSEQEWNWPADPSKRTPPDGMSGEECLTERWTHRKRVFGMHLYPGVGDGDFGDCFGHLFPGPGQDIGEHKPGEHKATAQLLEIAGTLAHDASRYDAARVLPVLPKQEPDAQENEPDEEPQPPLWELQEPAGVVGAYFAKRDATFFWGPAAGPGWDLKQPGSSEQSLFTQCPVKFIPIDYDDAEVALRDARKDLEQGNKTALAWAEVGGGAMWRRPRSELMDRLSALSGKPDKQPR